MKELFNSDKICVKTDTYGREFFIDVYDKYGHYIDEVKLDKDEMREIVKGFERIKEILN